MPPLVVKVTYSRKKILNGLRQFKVTFGRKGRILRSSVLASHDNLKVDLSFAWWRLPVLWVVSQRFGQKQLVGFASRVLTLSDKFFTLFF